MFYIFTLPYPQNQKFTLKYYIETVKMAKKSYKEATQKNKK